MYSSCEGRRAWMSPDSWVGRKWAIKVSPCKRFEHTRFGNITINRRTLYMKGGSII